MRRPGLTTALALTLGAAMPLKAGAEDKLKPRDLVGQTVVVKGQSTEINDQVSNVRGVLFERDGQQVDSRELHGDTVYEVTYNGNFPNVNEYPAATISSARMVDGHLRVFFTVANPDGEPVCVAAPVKSFDAERGLVVASDSFERVEQERVCSDSDTVLALVNTSDIKEPDIGEVEEGDAMLGCEEHAKDVPAPNVNEFDSQIAAFRGAAQKKKFKAALTAFDRMLELEGICIPELEAGVALNLYRDTERFLDKYRLLEKIVDAHPKGAKTVAFIRNNIDVDSPTWKYFLADLGRDTSDLESRRDDNQNMVECYLDTSKCEELGIDVPKGDQEWRERNAAQYTIDIGHMNEALLVLKKVPTELRKYLFEYFTMQVQFMSLDTDDSDLKALLRENEGRYGALPVPMDPISNQAISSVNTAIASDKLPDSLLVLSPQFGVKTHQIAGTEIPLECEDFEIGKMRQCDVLEPGVTPVVADAGTDEEAVEDEPKAKKEREPREPRQPRERVEREPREKKEREPIAALERKDQTGITSSVEAGVVVDELHADPDFRPGAVTTVRATGGVDLPGGRTVTATMTVEGGSSYDRTDFSTAYTARPAHIGTAGVRVCQRFFEGAGTPVNPVACGGVTVINQPHLALAVGATGFLGADVRIINKDHANMHLRVGGGADSRGVQAGSMNATAGLVFEH